MTRPNDEAMLQPISEAPRPLPAIAMGDGVARLSGLEALV